MFISVLISINLLCLTFAQDNGRWGCEDNCGSGTLQEYWSGAVDCVCSLDCAGYGDACCNFYDECFENPSNLELSDFVGTWNGNITNDQTWSYDDPISLVIDSDGTYTVTNNPGGHLVSDLYSGTEEVYYGTNFYGVNVLQFQWVSYYHYACGGPCYTGASFQVMEYGDGEMTLFYNNGSGPAPQANSMFLSMEDEDCNPDLACGGALTCCDGLLYPTTCCADNCDAPIDTCIEEECIDGEFNNENPCNPMECWDGQWFEIVIDCAEQMGVPCQEGIYIAPPENECCSTCIMYGDLNQDGAVNINDVIITVNIVLGLSEYNQLVDMNNDGFINVVDVVQIVNIILN